jgi:hypothetical protein
MCLLIRSTMVKRKKKNSLGRRRLFLLEEYIIEEEKTGCGRKTNVEEEDYIS